MESIYRFTEEQLIEAKVITSGDLYKEVGMMPLMGKEITDVEQLRINPKTYEDITKIILKNNKNKYSELNVRFDWMNYSPVCDKDIDEWVIEIV